MLSNGPAKKQAETQWPAAIASVTFQALISRIGFLSFERLAEILTDGLH